LDPNSNVLCVTIRREHLDIQKKHQECTGTEKVAICKPSEEASGETKPANTLSWNSSPQICEKYICCA
jgi:hypothetical protein